MNTDAYSPNVVAGLLSEVRVHHPEAAHSLACHLDAKDAELAQKDAAISAARNDALSEVEGMLKVTHLIMNETERAMLIERVRALRMAGVIK